MKKDKDFQNGIHMRIAFVTSSFFSEKTRTFSSEESLFQGLLGEGHEVTYFGDEEESLRLKKNISSSHFQSFSFSSLFRIESIRLLFIRVDIIEVWGKQNFGIMALLRIFHPTTVIIARPFYGLEEGKKQTLSRRKKVTCSGADAIVVQHEGEKRNIEKERRQKTFVIAQEKQYIRKEDRDEEILSRNDLKENSYILFASEIMKNTSFLRFLIRAYEHIQSTSKIVNNTPLVLLAPVLDKESERLVRSLTLSQPLFRVIRDKNREVHQRLIARAKMVVASDDIPSQFLVKEAFGFGVPVIFSGKKLTKYFQNIAFVVEKPSIHEFSQKMAYLCNAPQDAVSPTLEKGRKRMYCRHGHAPVMKKTIDMYHDVVAYKRTGNVLWSVENSRSHRYS